MGRLIDADELKEMFADNGEGSWTYNETAIVYINAQPTAYKIEKVVEEMDELLWECYTDNGQGFSEYKKKMRDVVRKGGV